MAVVDTNSRQVTRWIDLRPAGETRGLRPIGVRAAPVNPAISSFPYVVVLNQYGNFASVIDATSDTVVGEFETGFYGEKLVFNRAGTRLYITDRYKDAVRAFRVDQGPRFTQLAVIPTGDTQLERTNPRDLDISADGRTLYVANTLGHTVAAINIDGDANTLTKVMPVGGLATDVKVAGRWGIVAGQETNTRLNEPETGHGLPTKRADGVAIRNNGQPLGYTPVMTDATRATTFDDIGSELNVFDTSTNRFVFRYVDEGRDQSQLVTPGQYVDLGDHAAAQEIIRGSGPEQLFVRGDLLFVTYAHSEQVQAFRINLSASDPSQILRPLGLQYTGGITPQGIEVSPDGRTVYVTNFQTEDVSFLGVDSNGNLVRQGYLPVGVTPSTPDPTTGGHGQKLFATDEEVGLRWFFSSAYSDDGQKSCGFCHWDGRQDGCQWNVAAASDRSDYTMARGTLRFAPGETTKSITLLVTDDGLAEGDEQVNLSLANPAGGCALGETAATVVTVVDNDPANSTTNPADDPAFFVREHYHDFLNREPEDTGLRFWLGQLNECGADAACREVKRINVSAAFFLSIEFQQTGYFVERLYKSAYGRRPTLVEFMPDTQEAGRGLVVGADGWREKLEANRRAFAEGWVARPAFKAAFDPLSNAQFVDRLFANAGVAPAAAERAELVGALDQGRETRAGAVRRVAENAEFTRREFNSAFVLMQYFGYLRRDPDAEGFNFWLGKLDQFGGDFVRAEMVKAFISSAEYARCFGG